MVTEEYRAGLFLSLSATSSEPRFTIKNIYDAIISEVFPIFKLEYETCNR